MSQGKGKKSDFVSKTGKRNKIDWDKLKACFMAGNETLNEMKTRLTLGHANFFKKTKGWREERNAIRQEAIRKTSLHDATKFYGDIKTDYKEILRSLNWQIMGRLKKATKLDAEGNIKVIRPLKPQDVSFIAKSVMQSIQSVHLLEGKPTENTANVSWKDLTEKYNKPEGGQAPAPEEGEKVGGTQ